MVAISDAAAWSLPAGFLVGSQAGAQFQNNDTPGSADHLGTLSKFVAGGSDTLEFVPLEPFEQGVYSQSPYVDTDFYSFSYQQGLMAIDITLTLKGFTRVAGTIDNVLDWEGWLQFNAISGFAGDPDFSFFAENGGAGSFSDGVPNFFAAPPVGTILNGTNHSFTMPNVPVDGSGTAIFEIIGNLRDSFNGEWFGSYDFQISVASETDARISNGAAATSEAAPAGFEQAFISGTAGADILNGTPNDDVIRGNGGSDTASGNAGNDEIQGGNGLDNLAGGEGDDHLFGDAGSDSLAGEAGNDRLVGGSGADNLSGGIGNDNLIGAFFNDTMLGGEGDDRLNGGSGVDIMNGGGGQDYLIGGFAADQMTGGAGKDRYNGGGGDDDMFEGDGLNGSDYIGGGFGLDQVFYAVNQAAAMLDDNGAFWTVTIGGNVDTVLADVEQIVFNDGTVLT